MRHLPIKSSVIVILCLSIASACGQTPVIPNTAASATAVPATEEAFPEQITIEEDMTFGSGSFDYMDTRAGLSELPGYQATLTITFDGTRNGQAEKWSKTYTMLAIREPQARQLTIARTSGSSNTETEWMAEMNGMAYERIGEDACTANPVQEGHSLGERREPASFLSGVIGATEAGEETVNGTAAKHYTFDQAALGEQDLTESTGELWVASEGNYLVKYLLTRKGKADYFGEETEGTLTLDYELSDPSQPVTITLPEDCPPGLVNAPQLQDAKNVTNEPGLLSYDTAATLSDAAAFYQEQMAGLGWKANGEPIVSDTSGFLGYTKGSQSLSIIINKADSGATVTILLENGQK